MKKSIHWHDNYLIIVQELKTSPHLNQVNIYDLTNKFIAYSIKCDLVNNVASSINGNGQLYIITSTSKLINLNEKDLATKMEMFFRKNLYPIAISVAKSNNCDINIIMDIYQMFGDHLYEKRF